MQSHNVPFIDMAGAGRPRRYGCGGGGGLRRSFGQAGRAGCGGGAAAILTAVTLILAASTCAAGPISDRAAAGPCSGHGHPVGPPAEPGLAMAAAWIAVGCPFPGPYPVDTAVATVHPAGDPFSAASATLLPPWAEARAAAESPPASPLAQSGSGGDGPAGGAAIDVRLNAHIHESLRVLAPLEDLVAGRGRGAFALVGGTTVGPGLVDNSVRDVAVLFLLETVIQPRLEIDGSRTFSLFRLGRFSLERTGDPGGIRLTEHGSGLSWDLPRTPQPVHRLDHPSRSFVAEQHRSLLALAAYIVSRTLASPWFYVCLLVSLAFGISVRRWSRRARTGPVPAGAHQYPRPLSR